MAPSISRRGIYTAMLVLSLICLLGTITTNVQQYAQYNNVQQRTEKENSRMEKYEELKLLYDAGVLENEPIEPIASSLGNSQIDTPYNCLNIPISILFWTLTLISTIIFLLSFTLNLTESNKDKLKLQIFTSLAMCSSLIGVVYWAIHFHH